MADAPEQFAMDWKELVRHVKEESSSLVLLPEMPFHYWFAASRRFDKKTWQAAVESHSRWIARLSDLAPATVIGTRPINRGNRRFNDGFVWRDGRGVKGVHLKSYLPDDTGYYEASWYERGRRDFTPFSAAGLKVGMMTCSDVWAMPHARAYGKKGVHLIVVPRATEGATTEKWLAGGKVAAVISGSFNASSNRVGERGEAKFGGRGWVVGPDGEVLGMTSKEEPFKTVEIDPKKAEAAKKTYPRYSLEPD